MSRIRLTTKISAVAASVLVLSSAIGTTVAFADTGSDSTPAPSISSVTSVPPDNWFPNAVPAGNWFPDPGATVTPDNWFPNAIPAGNWFPNIAPTAPTDPTATSVSV